jgi:diguanylate cyclase (GGDEF)-like protein
MLNELKASEKQVTALNRDLLESNRKLQELALLDPHTGIFNYRYLEDAAEAEFQRAKRESGCFSVIMIDLDYFKAVNDVYGHQTGDLVLKQFAAKLRGMLRQYDILVRSGGEEFVIISPGIRRAGALQLARRLLNAITVTSFGNRGRPIKLKLSLAVASYPEDRITKGMGLLELADAVLNKVKEAGGNSIYSSLDLKRKRKPRPARGDTSAEIESLKGKIEKLTMRGKQGAVEAIFAFAKTIELRDQVTGRHVEKTVFYAANIAKKLKLLKDDIKHIEEACVLHDLGKVGVADKILRKRGKLTKKEFEAVKRHPQIGADIIRPIKSLRSIIPFMVHHHEWWNGKGYPDGLKGEEIPIGARIIAVADAYQALVSNRPYRKAYSKKDAIKIIEAGSGTQFDPKVVGAFLMMVNGKKAPV